MPPPKFSLDEAMATLGHNLAIAGALHLASVVGSFRYWKSHQRVPLRYNHNGRLPWDPR